MSMEMRLRRKTRRGIGSSCGHPARHIVAIMASFPVLAEVLFNHFGVRAAHLALLVFPFVASLNRGCKWLGVQTLTAERRRLV